MFLEVVNFSKIYEKIQQAKSLQTDISNTELLLSNAIAALTAIGIKTANLKKIVQDIDVSNKQINQVNFSKNAAGILSIANTLIDATVDSQVRPIVGTLLDRNITSSAVEKDKRTLIAGIKKEVAKYGMKTSDFDAVMKKMFTPGQTDLSYLIYSADGYLISYGIDESSPFGGGGNGGGSSSGGGNGGGSSSGGGSGGGNTEPSLQWYQEPVVGLLGGQWSTQIDSVLRSGSNVPVGEISSHQFVINNSLESNSRQETLSVVYTLRGLGSFKIYRNDILLWDLPSEASPELPPGEIYPYKIIPVEYQEGEPGAYYWVTGSFQSISVIGTFSNVNLDGNPIFDHENPNSTIQTNDLFGSVAIGLMRGENVIRFEFTPSQPNSSVRIFDTFTDRYSQPA